MLVMPSKYEVDIAKLSSEESSCNYVHWLLFA